MDWRDRLATPREAPTKDRSGHAAHREEPPTRQDGRLLLKARESAQDDDDVGITQTALLTHSVDTKLGGNVLRGSLHARILVEDR